MGARRPFSIEGEELADVYERERALYREVANRVEGDLDGVGVLAVELVSPARFCVYVDHPSGVDHALCERVTHVLRPFLDRFSVDVSSPGVERPLRTHAHFAHVVGRRVALRTSGEIRGRKRFRGELVEAGERAVRVQSDGETAFEIPYEAIVRGNLIDEG